MNASSTCPRCGTPLPPNAAYGVCPRCLLGQNLFGGESVAAADATEQRSTAGTPAGRVRGFRPPTPEQLVDHFPQLEILSLVGQGGMGAVYKARQRGLDRIVALKILAPAAAEDEQFAERFHREARALARLKHPHIVGVYDSGRSGPYFYLTMEYVDGVNLRQAMRAGQVRPEQALEMVGQICDALQYAHDEHVVHRDIKPENVLVDSRGQVKVADFGLAKMVDPDVPDFTLTATHQVMGTPRYMAPEQLEGARDVDHRADIYSLGVVFYELLTGELPLGRFAPPSKRVQIDVRLDDVVLRTLEKQPDLRYQQASELRTDVDDIRAHGLHAAGDAPAYEYRSKWSFLGLPLVHVTSGRDPRTRRGRVAKGWLAIGPRAVGGIAIGGVTAGVISVGGVAFGLLALGGVALGLLALGGVAAGGFALGGTATGYEAAGGVAVGYRAAGGLPVSLAARPPYVDNARIFAPTPQTPQGEFYQAESPFRATPSPLSPSPVPVAPPAPMAPAAPTAPRGDLPPFESAAAPFDHASAAPGASMAPPTEVTAIRVWSVGILAAGLLVGLPALVAVVVVIAILLVRRRRSSDWQQPSSPIVGPPGKAPGASVSSDAAPHREAAHYETAGRMSPGHVVAWFVVVVGVILMLLVCAGVPAIFFLRSSASPPNMPAAQTSIEFPRSVEFERPAPNVMGPVVPAPPPPPPRGDTDSAGPERPAPANAEAPPAGETLESP